MVLNGYKKFNAKFRVGAAVFHKALKYPIPKALNDIDVFINMVGMYNDFGFCEEVANALDTVFIWSTYPEGRGLDFDELCSLLNVDADVEEGGVTDVGDHPLYETWRRVFDDWSTHIKTLSREEGDVFEAIERYSQA